MFATRKNIEIFRESSTWFLDGTFKTSPNILAQIFTIIGLWKRTGHEEVVAVPTRVRIIVWQENRVVPTGLGNCERSCRPVPCSTMKTRQNHDRFRVGNN